MSNMPQLLKQQEELQAAIEAERNKGRESKRMSLHCVRLRAY
jgi:hypothetical protein